MTELERLKKDPVMKPRKPDACDYLVFQFSEDFKRKDKTNVKELKSILKFLAVALYTSSWWACAMFFDIGEPEGAWWIIPIFSSIGLAVWCFNYMLTHWKEEE